MDQKQSSKRRSTTAKAAKFTALPADLIHSLSATAVATAPPPVASKAKPVEEFSTDDDTQANPWTNRRASAQATRAANARQVSGRRRFVDPTTCERDYSEAEMEFMQAMADYKQSSGRMFPTWSEVLEVIKALGYDKPRAGDTAPDSLDAAKAH